MQKCVGEERSQKRSGRKKQLSFEATPVGAASSRDWHHDRRSIAGINREINRGADRGADRGINRGINRGWKPLPQVLLL